MERSEYSDLDISWVIVPGLTAGVDAFYKLPSNLIDEDQFGASIIQTALLQTAWSLRQRSRSLVDLR
jgi:hypothetical protein